MASNRHRVHGVRESDAADARLREVQPERDDLARNRLRLAPRDQHEVVERADDVEPVEVPDDLRLQLAADVVLLRHGSLLRRVELHPRACVVVPDDLGDDSLEEDDGVVARLGGVSRSRRSCR